MEGPCIPKFSARRHHARRILDGPPTSYFVSAGFRHGLARSSYRLAYVPVAQRSSDLQHSQCLNSCLVRSREHRWVFRVRGEACQGDDWTIDADP